MNDPNATVNVILGTTFLLPALVTISLTAVPWITDRREAFGVTVPPAAHTDPAIRRLKRGFSWTMIASGTIAMLTSLAIWQRFGTEPAIWTISAASVALTLIGFAAQQICRRTTRSIAARHNWRAAADRRDHHRPVRHRGDAARRDRVGRRAGGRRVLRAERIALLCRCIRQWWQAE